MIVDYHTHTSLCKHAVGEAWEYVEKAIEFGLDEIGCSEHIPMPGGFDEKHRMSLEEYTRIYAPAVRELVGRYKDRIRVRRGIEADYFPGTEAWVSGFIREQEFDYVIGSVHFLGSWGFDDIIFVHQYDERDVDEVYEQYFDAVKRSATSGMFDIIAHCDLVKKFGHRPSRNLRDIAWEAMKTIRDEGLCVEINTSGLRKPVKEVYPSGTILEIIRELGIPLTLGSDAHAPEDVGRDFDSAVGLVERYGGGKIAVFEGRQRRMVPVSGLVTARKARKQ